VLLTPGLGTPQYYRNKGLGALAEGSGTKDTAYPSCLSTAPSPANRPSPYPHQPLTYPGQCPGLCRDHWGLCHPHHWEEHSEGTEELRVQLTSRVSHPFLTNDTTTCVVRSTPHGQMSRASSALAQPRKTFSIIHQGCQATDKGNTCLCSAHKMGLLVLWGR
jgi:hypothetical protein